VADQLPIVWDVNAAQSQRAADLQAMRVRADSNPKVGRKWVSSIFKWVEVQPDQAARIIPEGQYGDNAEHFGDGVDQFFIVPRKCKSFRDW
jgi:hypothetical protein